MVLHCVTQNVVLKGIGMNLNNFIAEQKKYAREQIAEKVAKIQKRNKFTKALLKTALVVNPKDADTYIRYGGWCELEVKREDLPRLRQFMGKISEDGKDIKSAEDGTVWVFLKFEDWPDCRVKYEVALTETDKCKIVVTKSTYDQTSLVCERE